MKCVQQNFVNKQWSILNFHMPNEISIWIKHITSLSSLFGIVIAAIVLT